MPKSEDENVPYKRLVLGFDGGCSACGELARRIGEELGDRLGVVNLEDPRAVEWRGKALGENIPRGPTLFEVDGDEVRAWTGKQIALKLSLSLGPADTWRVMQRLGEIAADGGVGGGLTASVATGMSRGRFLKGVGGAVVAMGALSGGLASPAGAQSNSNTQSTIVQVARTKNEVVGASIAHGKNQTPVREEHTFDETYGFTLWAPDPSDEDHGGDPVVRVALAYGLKPGQIGRRVQERVSAFSELSLKPQALSVGEKKYKGTAVGPIPGSTPSTEVYVPVEGRVYQVNVYEPTLSAEGRRLLSSIRFDRPSRSADSFRSLPDGKKAETHQKSDTELAEREKAARKAARVVLPEGANDTPRTGNLSATSVPALAEYETLEAAGPPGTENLALPTYRNELQIAGGCWVPTSTFFFQTQHGEYANRRWGARWTGWTIVGRPNYWGQYTHGNIGYGRCASTYYTNDMYAVDYPLQYGDVVFSPFAGGVVTFAGRNYSHANYGIFVVIKTPDGRYVSMSAHLSGLARGIYRGARVTNTSIIGYAGATGHPSIPVGETHLHQAYYRYPRYKPDGSPYGGRGLKVMYHRYTGTAARKAGYRVPSYNPYYNVYNLDFVPANYSRRCYEGIKCGQGYAISN